MRSIEKIVIHATGGPQNQTTAVIKAYWKNVKKWKDKVGYHLIINADGSYERLAPDSEVTYGVGGHNAHSIHICYKGGVKQGVATDNRTNEQKKTLLTLVRTMRSRYPKAKIYGHRDLSPDRDGDGQIEKNEWLKACPCFDVKEWLSCVGINQ